jgi:hypothetical protein
MKLSKAQELAEQAIYDYTSSSKWQQVKYMTWTTAEMQDVIAKALVKNIEVIPCCTELCFNCGQEPESNKHTGLCKQCYVHWNSGKTIKTN